MSSRRGNLVSAFDLVSVVEQLPPDKHVECLCAWEKTLYIGTSDASILYYSLVDGKSPLGKTIYQSKLRVRKQLDADRRKTLQQLTLIPSMNRLLAQLDGTIYVLDMQRLEVIDTRDRITKVACYCIDEGRSPQSSSCEIIVAQQKRKSLLMYTYNNGDRFVPGRDIPLPDQPVAMARDGNSVCVAISSQHFDAGRYLLINLADSGSAIELPPYEIGISPLVKRTAKDEFLINTGDIGVIVSSEGTSNRPPIEWRQRRPHTAGYQFPYVVTWSKDTNSLHVFSLMDQQRKQDIPFLNGKCLGQFHGKLYAAVNTSVYLLALVPLKEQVTRLFEQQHVEEAILLAETIAAVEESKNPDKADEYIGSVKQQAAFLYFSQGQFSKAEILLLEGNTDPREIISKFEGLLPTSSTYCQQIEMESAEELANDGKINIKEAKKFLIRYLKEVRTSAVALGRKEEVDTVLVKLLAEDNPSSLIKYIEHHELYLNFDDAKLAFEKNQCYYALGSLYYYNGDVDTALNIWTRIYDGKLSDNQFPGLDHIVKFLTSSIDNDLLLKYSKWVLDHDEVKGVKIFIDRLRKDKGRVQLEHSIVLEKLSPYVQASVLYLEHLIHQLELKDEVFHTRLGMLYLEKVLKLKEEKNTKHLKEARAKLQGFLEESSSYRASFLLNRVQDTDLYKECAILYGRMDEHEKALSILAHHLQDYEGAERYCSIYTKGRSRQDRQRVYQTLLTVYLRPSDSSKSPLIKQALTLLNTHGEEFDAAKVLQILPSQWEISTVKDFLVRSIRSTTNAGRTSKIEHSLAKGENLQTKFELMKLQEVPVKITDTRVCPVCQLPFTEATAFVRYPNGVVTHLKCGRNKNICPITGTWFSEY